MAINRKIIEYQRFLTSGDRLSLEEAITRFIRETFREKKDIHFVGSLKAYLPMGLLEKARIERGMNLRDFSRLFGFTQHTYGKYSRYTIEIGEAFAKRIEEANLVPEEPMFTAFMLLKLRFVCNLLSGFAEEEECSFNPRELAKGFLEICKLEYNKKVKRSESNETRN